MLKVISEVILNFDEQLCKACICLQMETIHFFFLCQVQYLLTLCVCVFQESPEFPFISLPEKLSGNKMSDILLMSPKTVDDISDSVVLNMEPEVPHQNRCACFHD